MATILNTNLAYDPRYHTFESWASLMCEQYAAQQLAIPDARASPAPSSTTTGKNGLKLLSILLTQR
jgi:hypothetical protein